MPAKKETAATKAAPKKAAAKPVVKKTTKTAAAEPKTATKKATKPKLDPILRQLLESGAHFGHQASRWNPKMAQYIYTTRGGVHIIDLTQTAEQLKAAKNFVEGVTKSGGKVLFVATKRQAKAAVEAAAKEAGMPYVTYRWLGGMLTNLDTISRRVLRLKKLRTESAETGFSAMSKKDRAATEREMEILERTFAGVADMDSVPQAVFVVDMLREHTAMAEAHKLNLPVIAMCDTNADPEQAEYPIASNDDAISAIKLIVGELAAAAKTGASLYAEKAAKEAATKEETE